MADQTSDQKKKWKNKHLCTVCAFANSYGGRLVIGNADSFLPEEATELSQNIYKKISEALDIHPHVRPIENKGRACVAMDIKPSPEPISLDGLYYRRVGKVDRELVGDDLENFILLRDRRARLGLLVPGAIVKDLDKSAINKFRSITKVPKKIDNTELMQSMNLMQKDLLKGSAVVMFHSDPSKFIVAPDIRIGRFSSSGLMGEMDIISGPAFLQSKKAIDILSSKYILNGEYPMDAIEEAIINAIAHKDYSVGDPIRIRVYKKRIIISNSGGLNRKDLSTSLEGRSRPANPAVADIFVRAGMMRLMGTGIPKMNAACHRSGISDVVIEASKDDFAITFSLKSKKSVDIEIEEFEESSEKSEHITCEIPEIEIRQPMLIAGEVKDRETRTREFRIISLLTAVGTEEVAAKEIMSLLELKHRPTFMSNYLEPAIEEGYIERTQEKPTSRNQKYKATKKGLALM